MWCECSTPTGSLKTANFHSTYKNIEDCVKNHDGSKIRWGFGMDFAERLPHVFHPELVYKLNSKRWLAVIPKPRSANDQLLECEIKCPKHQTKTKEHKEMWYYGGADCHECAAGIEAEITRIANILQRRSAPYVLKLTQSLSSVGTNIVESEEDRKELLEKMSDYLSNYLPRITKENAYLYTTTLVLSDHIPGNTMALNFFVRRDGSCVFSGACNQLATGESGRQATAITYADQEKLEKKYRKTLDIICKALHDEGYYGAVGADIMEDEDGSQFTIDLNVRTPLSLVLYLLKGHFNEKRGFGMALVYECVQLNISREELEEKFNKEFSEGRIILLGSARFGEKKQWAYGMIIAGEEKKDIDDLSDRILKFEA